MELFVHLSPQSAPIGRLRRLLIRSDFTEMRLRGAVHEKRTRTEGSGLPKYMKVVEYFGRIARKNVSIIEKLVVTSERQDREKEILWM